MFWTFVFFICIASIIIACIIDFTGGDEDAAEIFGGLGVVVGFICLIVLLAGHGIQYTNKFDLRKIDALLPAKIEQREELVDLIRSEMSAEEYQALMSLEDPEAVVILLKDVGASDVLVTRATLLVELNRDINSLENEVVEKRIDMCNDRENIFVPRFFAFGIPECDYDFTK